MAYRKKGAKSASRRSYRRRYTRRRRYRRKYPRRSGRRFPKGTEVKSITKTFALNTGTVASGENISYYPGYCTTIGGSVAGNGNMSIPLGTGMNQRVGAKVEPIKLRISGSCSLVSKAQHQNTFEPNFWQVRCLVYQVKGGNPNYSPSNSNYHQLAMINTDGNLTGKEIGKLLSGYFYNDDTGIVFSFNNWLGNNVLARTPLRRGLGGMFRVLYKKSFWINSQKNPVKQFRFVCRVPKRIVYPESITTSDNNEPQTDPNNAIYIVWMFQPGSFNVDMVPVLNLNYVVDLFYTDK